DATHLYFNKTWDGDLGGINEYNRPQISTTMDGRCLFFSWIDTDIEGLEENTSPDIYCVSYDLYADVYSDVQNVTMFTPAMWVAFMGSQSHYVFTEINGDILTCTIPFVYQELDPGNPLEEVQFWYIDGFTFDFLLTDINEFENNILDVSQNHPNPFNGTSVVTVKITKATDLSLEIYNLTGQKVYEINNGKVSAGSHTLTIDASNLSPGVYFYTVFAGENSVTKKMIVN
ncbi:MAG: T9SS type A sorting domain-containing protein, partial [Bacteroidales bacterium]|nr:T9SS type A sorting domain-containing protein [Bacteroidales bacterium]